MMLETITRRLTADDRPLRVGDTVEIKSLTQIAATLDDEGRLDGMPFMPEMAAHCGELATVVKSAHKSCDGHGHIRWLDDTVHLEGFRCEGWAHGGCQARCRTYWKTAWLTRVPARRSPTVRYESGHQDDEISNRLKLHTIVSDGNSSCYMCQATEVNTASRPLPATELRQYIRDVSSGNFPLRTVVWVMAKTVFNRYQRWSTAHLPSVLRLRGGHRLNYVQGHLSKTPKQTLDLAVGERVRIRPLAEIEATLNGDNMNRGLMFDSEMATRCGSSSTVADRVQRLVDDRTGELIEIKSDCVILDGATCSGTNRRLCPRNQYDYWREIWLARESD